MRILIVRHAEPDARGELTEAGHKEAAALAQWMRQLQPDRLYASPLKRAQDTMRYTAEALGKTGATEDWLKERGHWMIEQEGLGRSTWWDIHGHTLRALDSADWRGVPPFDDPAFRAEYDQLTADSDAFLARHGYVREGSSYRIIQSNRECLAVFCHGGFGLTWLAHLLMLPLPLVWAGFNLAPSSVTTVLLDERNDRLATPRVLGLGELAHLHRAGLPRSFHGVKANTR